MAERKAGWKQPLRNATGKRHVILHFKRAGTRVVYIWFLMKPAEDVNGTFTTRIMKLLTTGIALGA